MNESNVSAVRQAPSSMQFSSKQQYAISFSDCMSTYGLPVNGIRQQNQCIELAAGIINAEIEKGARYLETIYVDQKPAIFVFEK